MKKVIIAIGIVMVIMLGIFVINEHTSKIIISEELSDEQVAESYCEYEGYTLIDYCGVDDEGNIIFTALNSNGHHVHTTVSASYARNMIRLHEEMA